MTEESGGQVGVSDGVTQQSGQEVLTEKEMSCKNPITV